MFSHIYLGTMIMGFMYFSFGELMGMNHGIPGDTWSRAYTVFFNGVWGVKIILSYIGEF